MEFVQTVGGSGTISVWQHAAGGWCVRVFDHPVANCDDFQTAHAFVLLLVKSASVLAADMAAGAELAAAAEVQAAQRRREELAKRRVDGSNSVVLRAREWSGYFVQLRRRTDKSFWILVHDVEGNRTASLGPWWELTEAQHRFGSALDLGEVHRAFAYAGSEQE